MTSALTALKAGCEVLRMSMNSAISAAGCSNRGRQQGAAVNRVVMQTTSEVGDAWRRRCFPRAPPLYPPPTLHIPIPTTTTPPPPPPPTHTHPHRRTRGGHEGAALREALQPHAAVRQPLAAHTINEDVHRVAALYTRGGWRGGEGTWGWGTWRAWSWGAVREGGSQAWAGNGLQPRGCKRGWQPLVLSPLWQCPPHLEANSPSHAPTSPPQTPPTTTAPPPHPPALQNPHL